MYIKLCKAFHGMYVGMYVDAMLLAATAERDGKAVVKISLVARDHPVLSRRQTHLLPPLKHIPGTYISSSPDENKHRNQIEFTVPPRREKLNGILIFRPVPS